ncbi:MAG: sensor histidine kinase [Caldilineaceae bacterium]|nr:sensor histidine kinase [Caldilineaceae bacterium]MBP8124320.1 sensor histidine kinase [Caldilineaceae bacterium]MBP9074314.1 sensor histidine kinase [Caldilineaceae bacterium]
MLLSVFGIMGVQHSTNLSRRLAVLQLTQSEQLSTLRQMMCLLACQTGDNINERLGQSLRLLCQTTPLAAAGIVWYQQNESSLQVRWPQNGPIDPYLETALVNPIEFGEVPISGGDGSWQIVPMRCNGNIVGRLWGTCLPGYVCGENSQDLLLLAAHQLALAYHNALLYKDLIAQTERRSILLQRITHVNEECRRHVARELHDEISQGLTALVLQADTIQFSLDNNTDLLKIYVPKFRQELVRLQDEVQRLVLELRPALLEQKGLLDALRWYGRQRLHMSGSQFRVSGGQCAPRLPSLVKLTLYRIGQEAIANSARHAKATHVWLEISCAEEALLLTVRDDGCGFDPNVHLSSPEGLKGMGILGMRERALLLNGKLTIQSEPGKGACVQVRIPFEEMGIDGCDSSVLSG